MTSARSSVWTLLFIVTSSIVLASCDSSSDSISSFDSEIGRPVPDPDRQPAPIVISESFELGIRDEVVVTFSEPMIPATLKLEGMLADLAARPEWSNDNKTLTVGPAEGAWESGRHKVSGSLESESGVSATLDLQVDIRLVFDTFQEASFVIGQLDLESSEDAGAAGPTINTVFSPFGIPTLIDGRLWIPELGNNRLLGFDGVPSTNLPDASWVAGQPDFESDGYGTSATEFWTPVMGIEHEGYFYLLERGNSRVSIFEGGAHLQASAAIGQENLDTRTGACSASGLDEPSGMLIVDNKLLIADSENNRVLIWNTVPKAGLQHPDLVLGQAAMDSCARNDDDQDGAWDREPTARTLHYPSSIWSDGKRLVVADEKNSRVLIWNTFPEANFAPADIVLGQSDFSSRRSNITTAESLYFPYGLWSNGLQLFVADLENRRVLIWDEFPTENAQPADKVLGQPDFDTAGFHDQASARTFSSPGGIVAHRDKLLVLDTMLDRVLIFEASQVSED